MKYPSYDSYINGPSHRFPTIPSHWISLSLRHLTRFAYGKSLETESREGEDFEVFGSNGPVGKHKTSNTLSPVLIIGRKGSYGKVSFSAAPVFAIDTTYFVDRSQTLADLKWLYYLLVSLGLDENSQDTGVPGLSRELAYSTPIAHPPLPEQKAIATFLDRETAKIDDLIAKKERLIELLEEKRQAVISHAVTKGLNPDAPMKDSGVEWLGEVPEHWEVKKLKRVSPRQEVGIVVNPSSYVSEQGHPFIYGGDILEGVIKKDVSRRIDADGNASNKKSILKHGDLVTVRVGYPGITAVVPEEMDGSNCASVMISRKGNGFSSDWLCAVFNSWVVRLQIDLVKYGAAQEQFNITHAVDFLIPTPPKEEQVDIFRFLDAENKKIFGVVETLNKAISKLKEQRTALISAAVTGKIDVRGLVDGEAA